LIISFLLLAMAGSLAGKIILFDPLTGKDLVLNEGSKISTGGEYSARGWRALSQGDMLVVELANAQGFEGALEVDISNLDWVAANASAGTDQKIHFLNMFSNAKGDHHEEHGGTSTDALWSLRGGTETDGSSRYGNGFKFYWASKGAKRTTGNNYQEAPVSAPSGWIWDKSKTYTFRVAWSKSQNKITVSVNGTQFTQKNWAGQVEALKYVFFR